MTRHILLLSIGTRGDIQPFIALGTRLLAAGARVTLAGSAHDAGWVTRHGLEFAPAGLGFLELIDSPEARDAIKGKGRLSLVRKVMPMLRNMLEELWSASRDADAIVYHPKSMVALHIAEKLGRDKQRRVPAMLAFMLPGYTASATFPHPLLATRSLGGTLNRLSYALFNVAAEAPYRRLINTWRRETLGLGPAGHALAPALKLYAYSAHIVPRPPDWDAQSLVTGYWFMDEAAGWQPPQHLEAFLQAGPPPVYVGFGSMPMPDPAEAARVVCETLARLGMRGVISSGWGKLAAQNAGENICQIESAPHDWLFPRMRAVVHHGGAGTTAAALRAGRPTLICPFFGDQPFWGATVAKLGAGPQPLPFKRFSADRFESALRPLLNNAGFTAQAAALAVKIRNEDGAGVAAQHVLNVLQQA